MNYYLDRLRLAAEKACETGDFVRRIKEAFPDRDPDFDPPCVTICGADGHHSMVAVHFDVVMKAPKEHERATEIAGKSVFFYTFNTAFDYREIMAMQRDDVLEFVRSRILDAIKHSSADAAEQGLFGTDVVSV